MEVTAVRLYAEHPRLDVARVRDQDQGPGEPRVNYNYDVTAEIGKEEYYIVQDYGISADEGGGYYGSW